VGGQLAAAASTHASKAVIRATIPIKRARAVPIRATASFKCATITTTRAKTVRFTHQ